MGGKEFFTNLDLVGGDFFAEQTEGAKTFLDRKIMVLHTRAKDS